MVLAPGTLAFRRQRAKDNNQEQPATTANNSQEQPAATGNLAIARVH
jgi:hypothetical protein